MIKKKLLDWLSGMVLPVLSQTSSGTVTAQGLT